MGFYDKGKNDNKDVGAVPVINGNNPGVVAKETSVITNPDEMLTRTKYVINTQNNRTGVNTERLADIVSDLKGFAEGSTIKVTYYKEHYSETDTQSKVDSTDAALHPAHRSVLKIHGFEMKLTGPLQYEHDTADTINKLTGEAFTYPGFRPEKGDEFVMEVDTGKYAVMCIHEVPVRTSIRASTYYKISFSIADWMDTEEFEQHEGSVVDEAWFDKSRFLAEPGALLYHDEYVEIKFLKKQRTKMIKYFMSKFLDEILMYSYMRPDSIYDPYVMDFLHATLDFNETGHLATQLYEAAPFLKESIWSAIKDENVPLQVVPTGSATQIYKLGSKTVLANSLINKPYLYWVKSKCLQDYFDEIEEAESVYVAQLYPADFEVTSTTYALTTDTIFRKNKTYYTRSGTDTHTLQTDLTAVFQADKQYSYYDATTESYIVMTAVTADPGTYEYIPGTTKFGDKSYGVYLDDPYVYTAATVTVGEVIMANTYYEKTCTYGWKAAHTYYRRVDGVFSVVDKTVTTVPLATETYYIRSDEDTTTTTTSEGSIPADSTVPTITEGTSDQEQTLGDLLLHLHPHYTECPLSGSSNNSSGEGTDIGLNYILQGTNEHIDMLREFLKDRTLDLRKLHKCIENVWKLSDIQQFYKMPIYIYLARVGMRYIQYDEGIFER